LIAWVGGWVYVARMMRKKHELVYCQFPSDPHHCEYLSIYTTATKVNPRETSCMGLVATMLLVCSQRSMTLLNVGQMSLKWCTTQQDKLFSVYPNLLPLIICTCIFVVKKI
jgi:hypothetical protein